MKLSELIKGLDMVAVSGDTGAEIRDVTADSNSVTRGSLFICLNGRARDGHGYIRQAERYGAAAVITERKTDTVLTQVVVKNTRRAMSVIAANFYGHADKKMRLIGITGTNGKTTTAHFLTSVLTHAGVNCGLIGTLGTVDPAGGE